MRARQVALTLLVVTTCSPGCTDQSPVVRHDPERAQSALTTVLDAWKRGETRSLARHDPPIRFVDEDLVSGLRLAEYEIVEPDAPILPHKNIPVILSLRDARGRKIRRETNYQVSTDPALAVLRSDP